MPISRLGVEDVPVYNVLRRVENVQLQSATELSVFSARFHACSEVTPGTGFGVVNVAGARLEDQDDGSRVSSVSSGWDITTNANT